METVTAEASRFSIQTTITWEIADEPVPVGVAVGVGVGRADGAAVGVGRADGAAVGVGRADGAAVARAEGAGVADGLAAGVGDGRTDGADDGRAAGVGDGRADGADGGPLEGRSSAGLPDGLGALADGVSVANAAALAEAAGPADARTPVGAAGLTGAGVAWHAASMAASPNVATACRGLIRLPAVWSRLRRLLPSDPCDHAVRNEDARARPQAIRAPVGEGTVPVEGCLHRLLLVERGPPIHRARGRQGAR
ncbi:MAG TPA: hypothetical protein VF302_05545 [Candidatus Limnocylindrales bacterium]